MLAASMEKAQGILLWNLRRRVGCEALRANVQHLMDRSAFITGDAAAAAARRDRAMSTCFQGGDPGSVGQACAMSRLNHGMAWHGMVEVCEGAPVAVSGWVLTDRHDLRPCAAQLVVCIGKPHPLVT